MRLYDRKGEIPDGAMIIKEIFNQNDDAEPTDLTIMVKDKAGSWDGWFWTDGQPLLTPSPGSLADPVYNYDFYPNAAFGLYCVNCHVSADNPESTYSALRNIVNDPITYLLVKPAMEAGPPREFRSGIHYRTARMRAAARKMAKPVGRSAVPLRKPSNDFWQVFAWVPDRFVPDPLPFKSYDHVVQGPRPDGHRQFLTSDQCIGCHDATANNAAMPNMIFPKLAGPKSKPNAEPPVAGADELWVNLSPYGEWRYSLMGFSGRDPVFYTQLETEREIHPELAAEIDDKCLSCHAVMGQRQYVQDKGPQTLFTHQPVTDKNSTYGALARDGVSCTVCHRILADGLGTSQSYTGQFKLADYPKLIFGPYDDVTPLPMQNSLGLTPQYADHIRQSKLCGSCHTVFVPVLDVDKQYTAQQFNHPAASFHEQTTYFEWRNSIYSDELNGDTPQARSCQDCHMPSKYEDRTLTFRIANIEDNTFPFVDNRAPDRDLALKVRGLDNRNRYSRHSLHGINLFVTEMFNQNPWLLGIPSGGGKDGTSGGDYLVPKGTRAGMKQALESGLQMARSDTARIEITELRRTERGLFARVTVSNLAGHKFPSGVAFRRAFIEFRVRVGDETVWVSGATNSWGVIGKSTGGQFFPLPTEFFEGNRYQPHHTIVRSEDQVQIYEELVKDSKGDLTTSFLSLKTEVKDNRLLPKGWRISGPDARQTEPKGVSPDRNPEYFDESGTNVVQYEVPLGPEVKSSISVTATLYYQSLPPYYLKQRFKYIDKPATQAFFYFVSMLQLQGDLKDWKLKIAQASKSVP
jgi:hypothetical protein